MHLSVEDFTRDLDWNLLKIFHEIAQAGGISKASERTNLKQSAISLALKRLEGSIGTVLCKRSATGFELTREGALLAELCDHVMCAVREIPSVTTVTSSAIHGNLKLGLISNFTCGKLDAGITRFHSSFPNVELIISTIPSAHITGSVMRNEVDIGVAPTKNMRSELRYKFLSFEFHRLYCGSAHRLFGKQFFDPGQLKDEQFVLTGSDEPDDLRSFRMEHGLGENVLIVTEHLEEAKRFTTLGLGLCFLPESYASSGETHGRLWPLLPRDITPSVSVYVIDNTKLPQLTQRSKLRESFIACLE